MARDERVRDLVERLELPFNALGFDPYGISKRHLVVFLGALAFLYRTYFRVKCFGIENVPRNGRAMIVGNHSGGVAFDGAMVLSSLFLEMDPPRLGSAMVEKFINALPVSSLWSSRTGQFTGLPEHAVRLLGHADRLRNDAASPVPVFQRDGLDRAFEAASALLGPDAVQAAFDVGQQGRLGHDVTFRP